MFRNIILFTLIISPLFFLFVGYPINKTLPNNKLITSHRCYSVGDTKQFLKCFQDHERLGGYQLIQGIVEKMNMLQPNMGYLLFVFLLTDLFVLVLLL